MLAIAGCALAAGAAAVAHAKQGANARGACVPIPEVRWTVRVTRTGRDGDRRLEWTYATERSVDLDGDGRADAFVPVPRARDPQGTCPADVRREIYLARGGCGVLVGTIEGDLAPMGSARSHGLLDLTTTITGLRPRRGTIEIRYVFDGTQYVERGRTESTPRCEVHPADCMDMPHTRCELRGHPTIRSSFDPEHTSALLGTAAATAQTQCLAPASVVERCDVRPTFAPDGSVSRLEVRDCPRRRACVAAVFRALVTTPFAGEPSSSTSISFQIPPP